MNTLHVVIYSILFLVLASNSESLTVGNLRNHYWEIFGPKGNRNAASHLWSTYVLSRANQLSKDEINKLMGEFCPVSGSPVRPGAYSLYKEVQVKKATDPGTRVSTAVHVCCWPCICDIHSLVHLDTFTTRVKNGDRVTFKVLVIGNPCTNPSKIPKSASEVKCNDDGQLKGATKSDNGFIIIGMAQSSKSIRDLIKEKRIRSNRIKKASSTKGRCDARARKGFQSGMGKIFIDVASINLISPPDPTPEPELESKVKPCIGDDRRDFRCNWDYTHRVCAKLVDHTQGCRKLKWGTQDFWQITGQQRFEWSKLICSDKTRSGREKPAGSHWCICMWATEELIAKVGCDNVHLDCAATDVNHVLNAYNDRSFRGRNTKLENAKCCLVKKCPTYINNKTKRRIHFNKLQKDC